MIVLSTFGALVLAGTYSGQRVFVPDEAEAPVVSVERYAEHKRTLEIKPTGETCRWMAEREVHPIPASYMDAEDTAAAMADSKAEGSHLVRDTGTYEIVIAPGCDEILAPR